MTAITLTAIISVWGPVVTAVLCIFAAAILRGAERALKDASRTRLRVMTDRGGKVDRRARTALALTDERKTVSGALRVARVTATVCATAFATAAMMNAFGDAGIIPAIALLTPAFLLFVEALPRAWATASPELMVLALALPVRPIVTAFTPAARLVDATADLLLRPLRIDRPAHLPAAEGETSLLTVPDGESIAEEDERERVIGVLNLGQRRVEEVMMHRRDIEMIDVAAPPEVILDQAINSPHTRLPVYRGEPENIVGVIHAKDLSRAVHRFVAEHEGTAVLTGFDITDVTMEPYFVPESTPLDEQLREFLKRRTHFALVVDEYGALQGLVTLEDILEEIVGDIADEHDVEPPAHLTTLPDGSVEVEGGMPIRDLNRTLGWSLPDDEANTIAGLVLYEAQSIPTAGQVFSFHGFRFEVLEREGNRLTRLRVRKLI